MSRGHGLSLDNLISADVVTADGKMVVASEDENADLFWAIRGGGGNFGVCTSLQYKLQPVDTVYWGPMFYEIEETETMICVKKQNAKERIPHPQVKGFE